MTDNLDDDLDIKFDHSLSRKVTKGALWVIAASISVRVLSLVSAIILTKLLAPEDFGLMAIAMAIIAFSQGTTQTGFQSALIQKQDRPEDFLNTTWTFELGRNVILFLIIFLAAPLFASFFKEPRAVSILRVISLSFVFQGITNIGVVYFRKNLDFQKLYVLEIVPLIVYISVVIPLAFSLKNVWALVWASLMQTITTCFISYVMHPYRPRLDFSIKRARNLFNFGKWIFGSSIVMMVREQGMIMFVGKLLGIPILGFYNRAVAFSTMIFQQVSGIVWNVGYPAYSQLQFDPERFKQAYLKTLQLLTFIGIPMAGGLFVLSRDFVYLFLTDKWLPIVPLMQILCLAAMLDLINTPASIAFQAFGKPSIGTKISLVGLIILIITIYPLSSKWGIVGAVASLFLSTLIPSLIVWYMSNKLMRITYSEFFNPMLFSLISTVVMSFTIITVKKYFLVQVGFLSFFGLILLGIFIYIVVTFFFNKYTKYGIFGLIKERIAMFR